jgi:tRNA A37 threonylcarbamoyladenosine modification protein TsaB
MNIEIKIDDNQITLILKKDDEVVDEMSWSEKQNLSRELLGKIDELLSKNNVGRNEVKMTVNTDIDEKFTTVRIAKVVANTFNYVNE